MRFIPEECASLNNMSGVCTHIRSDVSYVCVSRVRYVLSSPSPCAIKYFFLGNSWGLLNFCLCKIFLVPHSSSHEFCKIIPQSGKCLVRGLVPCQIHRKKFMEHRQATTSHRGSLVNRTARQPYLKYAAFSNKANSNTKKWWITSSIWEITVSHTNRTPSCLNCRRHALQRLLTLIGHLKLMIGFVTSDYCSVFRSWEGALCTSLPHWSSCSMVGKLPTHASQWT